MRGEGIFTVVRSLAVLALALVSTPAHVVVLVGVLTDWLTGWVCSGMRAETELHPLMQVLQKRTPARGPGGGWAQHQEGVAVKWGRVP